MTPPTPRPGILNIAPYVGSKSGIPGAGRVIKLSSNESALGTSAKAVEAFHKAAGHLHRYPDGSAAKLRKAIAARFQLDSEMIVCGNGSDELLTLLARAYAGPGDEVLHSEYGFLIHAMSAHSASATPVPAAEPDHVADVDEMLGKITASTRVIFLANPNNPTGSYLPRDEVRRLCDGVPSHVVLVLDAAYAEYVTAEDYAAGEELVESFDNVVMTRTFSKIFGLGALRLGWAYCPPAIADVLNRMRGPFNVSGPAQAAGIAAMGDVAFTDRARAHNEKWRRWISERLRALGLAVYPSVANFVLVRFPDAPAQSAEAAERFLSNQGILPRMMDEYGLSDCLRITIGTEEEMRALTEALAQFVGERVGEREEAS